MLEKRFSGVIFFGTPHRGSGVASLATMAARLLELTSFSTSTNTQLSKDLEPDSRRLRFVSDSFQYRCARHELKIVSCYETDKMDFMSTLVGFSSLISACAAR